LAKVEASIKAEADRQARERGEEPGKPGIVRGFSQMMGLKLRFSDGTELTAHHLIALGADRFGRDMDLVGHEGFHGLVKEALTAGEYKNLLGHLGLDEESAAKLFGVRMAERIKELENRSSFQKIWDKVRKFARGTVQSLVGGPNAPAGSQEILNRIFAGEFFQQPKSPELLTEEKLAIRQSTPEGSATQGQQKITAAEWARHNLSTIDDPKMADAIVDEMSAMSDRDESEGDLDFRVIDIYGNERVVAVPDAPGMTMTKAHQEIMAREDVARAQYIGKGAVDRHPEDSPRPHRLTNQEVRHRVATLET
jgi:hypothetical protein